jgi:hypothetical protein
MTDEAGATKGRFDFIIYFPDYRHFCKVSFPIARSKLHVILKYPVTC